MTTLSGFYCITIRKGFYSNFVTGAIADWWISDGLRYSVSKSCGIALAMLTISVSGLAIVALIFFVSVTNTVFSLHINNYKGYECYFWNQYFNNFILKCYAIQLRVFDNSKTIFTMVDNNSISCFCVLEEIIFLNVDRCNSLIGPFLIVTILPLRRKE